MAMTARKRVFVAEYLVDLNASRAARVAGYSEKTCNAQAHNLMQEPEIQAEISRMMEIRAKKSAIKGERVIEELANIGFANFLDYVAIDEDGMPVPNLKGLTRAQAAAISEFTVDQIKRQSDGQTVDRIRLKFHNKPEALQLLGRHLELFVDKIKVTEGLSDDELNKQLIEKGLIRPPA